jgi:hypothetical protein
MSHPEHLYRAIPVVGDQVARGKEYLTIGKGKGGEYEE